MSETIGGPACAHLRVSYMTMNTDDGLTRGWWRCQTCQARFAPLPAAREEGRREGEAERGILQAQVDVGEKIRRYVAFVLTGDETGDVQLAADRAKSDLEAHAAQLVALREAAINAQCEGCRDGLPVTEDAKYPGVPMHAWPVNGLDGRTLTSACRAGRIRALSLPDAETALAKVREEAVREVVEYLRSDDAWRQFAHRVDDVVPQETHEDDRKVARELLAYLAMDLPSALNALGGT